MKLACNSLVEVWGDMGDVEEQMTSYKEGFEPVTEFLEPMKDSNEDYDDMMKMYSSNNSNEDTKKEVKNEKESITEKFLNKLRQDLDDDNNDLILLVILGIFIIFVLDSLVKMKLNF